MAEGGEVRSPTEGTQPDEKKSEEANGNESKGAKGPAASQAEKNGLQLMQQAEAKVKSASGWFGKLTGGATKLEDAADLYVRAANQFKVAKEFERAGRAFMESARIHEEKLESRHEAANNYAEAAQVFKKISPQDAVECYQKSIIIYSDMGRFSLSARYHMNIGEIYETDILDFDKAIENLEQAADFYRGEDSNASANKCLTKVAHMAAQQQHFEKAANLFEEMGKSSLDNNLLKYSAKDYFFKALLCWFCVNKDTVKVKMEEYKALHPAFDGTREQKLVTNLLEAVEEEDKDKYTEHVQEYDSISRLDNWLTAILLHIKNSMDADHDIN